MSPALVSPPYQSVSEFLLERGFLDAIVPRKELKGYFEQGPGVDDKEGSVIRRR